MKTFSLRTPCKNIFWTSNCRMIQFEETAMDRTIQIIVGRTTGLNVSKKSISSA
jgi:hypothetical protein